MTIPFKVIAVYNSGGLRKHILVSQSGRVYYAHCVASSARSKGDVLHLDAVHPEWALEALGFERPARATPDAPDSLLREVWPESKVLA